uniref:Short chain dehydrogenase gsfE n=1 Tax=Penicillium aethiopicum TaxID=36650 RepID=GSFE_PENAE|nr:RecName: Full=Short chain dehydrogenase gsfE; AltName: Full=Griseofulvin synthesis protein E [Penicillium aethiopicum]ADI24957.1 GsfE [Penicillium aethiopicum]
MPKTAFITGANGLSGSAIVEYLCNTTTSDDWGSIIVTSRSPFKSTVMDPRIKFIALDFVNDVSSLVETMKEVCGAVTHAYFCSYLHKDDFAESYTVNKALFENFIAAIDKAAPKLENVTLQTGGKYYNLHVEPVPSPARENDPRRYGPFENFYFTQEDTLAEMQRGKTWSWNVIRPEAIIGANSQPYGLNVALTIAMYFLICRELGSASPMPTNQRYWEGTDDVSYAPLIADLTIFVSTRKSCANEAFNVTNGDYFTWRYMWPRLAASLGAKADSQQCFEKPMPGEGELQLDWSLAEWCKDKRKVWEDLCDRQGLPGAKATFDLAGWAVGDFLYQRTWSATLSVNKARRFGWTGHMDSYQSFVDTFDKFRQLGLIPK